MKLFPILITIFGLLTGNISAISDTVPKTGRQMPDGAIPFYSFKNNVILNGFVNDTIPIRAMLDLGARGMAAPEWLRQDIEHRKKTEPVRFKVGEWQKTMYATFMNADSQFLHWYGEDCILLGWDFFNRRIMEVSYNRHYIRELKPVELSSLQGYDSIRFENRGMRLLIPTTVHISGKVIEGKCWIDTGLNGTLFFTYDILEKYDLDTSKSKAGRAKNLDTHRTKIDILKSDSIRIGNSVLTNRDVFFSESEWFVLKENDMYIGLLGNQFFKNFSVIFDFRKNNLYLKPVEE